MKNLFPLIAKTSFGFEDLLVEELKSLGAINPVKAIRAVSFEGDLEMMYKANLHSRVALRILKPIKAFPANNEQQLYDEVKKIDWSDYITVDDTLAVDAVLSNSNLDHSLYVALKTKDAIVDQFRDKFGKRPDVDTTRPTLRINIFIAKNTASISLDSSGESLHKRGYRQQQGDAPINETLAAGMILLSGWDKKTPFTDIMCGSGTIPIEATMLAKNIAPGMFKEEFGFERWKDFDATLWKQLRDDAESAETEIDFPITGIDKSYRSIDIAKSNAKAAGLSKEINFLSTPFEDYTPKETEGIIITNPPYGGRITDDDIFQLYKNIGDNLKKKFNGWSAWILTANKEAANKIGLHATRKIQLYNGSLECRLLKYQLYAGTKKKTSPTENSS